MTEEDLMSYLSWFKSERNVLINLFGKGIVGGYVKKTPGYIVASADGNDDAMRRLKEEAFERFMVVLFLQNSDQERFGQMMLEYRLEYGNKQYKFPLNIETMLDVMQQQPAKKRNPSKGIDKLKNESLKDKARKDKEASFAQKKKLEEEDKPIACYCCGKPDCLLPRYPMK